MCNNTLYLVCVQDLQKGFVDVWLALETVLDLVDIVNGVVELHRLVVLQWGGVGGAADGGVGMERWGTGRGVWWDGRIGLTAGRECWRLRRLKRTRGEAYKNIHLLGLSKK